jgi:hypothetical protein
MHLIEEGEKHHRMLLEKAGDAIFIYYLQLIFTFQALQKKRPGFFVI